MAITSEMVLGLVVQRALKAGVDLPVMSNILPKHHFLPKLGKLSGDEVYFFLNVVDRISKCEIHPTQFHDWLYSHPFNPLSFFSRTKDFKIGVEYLLQGSRGVKGEYYGNALELKTMLEAEK